MPTIKQIEANRLNAKKSTGPKTPAGKARSSRNAFIHGLSSQRPTVTIENSAEFNAFANKFMDQYEPLDPSEIFLVRRIACMAWRIQRAQCYETLVLDNLCNSIPEDDTRTDQDVFSQLLLDDFRNHQTLAKLQRYETQLERCILRCMKELRDSRKAKDANYTDVAYYLRDGQPREDYKDLVIPYGEGQADSTSNSPEAGRSKLEAISLNEPNSNNVAEASSFSVTQQPPQADSTLNPVHPVNPVKKIEPNLPEAGRSKLEAISPNEPNSNNVAEASSFSVTQQPPQADSTLNPVHPVNPVKKIEPNLPEAGSSKLEALSIDGLTNPDLPWVPAENKVYKTENQRIRNNPNQQKWSYDYTPDWYIRVLDAVHFSPKKRKTMTHRDLEKHAGCIVHTFQNPEQFLLDIHAITLRQKPIEPNLDTHQSSIENQESPNEANYPVDPVKKIEPNSQESHANEYELCEV